MTLKAKGKAADSIITNVTRLVIVYSIVHYFFHVDYYDSWLRVSWEWLRQQWWFRHDSFEPILATVGFGLPMMLWWGIDIAADLGWTKWFKDYQMVPENRQHIGLRGEYELGAVYSAIAYLTPFFIFDSIYPRRKLPEECPNMIEVVTGVCFAVGLYDLLFYPIHLALHRIPRLRRFHHRHHPSRPLTSAETLRHSLVDGSLQVSSSIVALKLLNLHPLTRALYNLVVTYLLTELHSGYDLPFMVHRIAPKGVLGGPPRHEIHHATGNHNYHQFFTYLDFLFGFASDAIPPRYRNKTSRTNM